MRAFVSAGNGGGRRFHPAALSFRAESHVHCTAVVAAAGALAVTLLITGFALPQAEWFALPERIDEMKERPREFWRHFLAVLLALCGLDTINDLAAVVRKPVAGHAGHTLCASAIKASMLFALLVLFVASFLSDPQLGHRQVNLLPFVPADYAGQWAELAVGVLGDILLLSGVTGMMIGTIELRSALASAGDATQDASAPAETTGAPGTARHDG